MAYTSKLVLSKNRAKKDGTYPLTIRVTISGKQTYVPLGYHLTETDWDEKNSRVRTSTKTVSNVTRLNNYILKSFTKINDICTQLLSHHLLGQINIRELRKFLIWSLEKDEENIQDALQKLFQGKSIEQLLTSSSDGANNDVFSYLKAVIKELNKAGRIGYAVSHDDLLKKLKNYHKKDTLRFEDIDYKFLRGLEAHHLGQGYTLGGLGVYLRTLKARYNDAIKEGLVLERYFPFKDYKIKKGSPNRKALTEDSFQKLLSLNLTPGTQRHTAWLLFMASYYMRGINWTDMAYFRVSNITMDFSRAYYQRRKTKKRYSIAIHTKLKAIIDEFLGENFERDDFVFPILTKEDRPEDHHGIIQKKRDALNGHLNKIGKEIGCKGMSFYSARHTYATRSKRKGVPTSAISDALGHATEQTTQHYLESFEDQVIDTYDEMVFDD